MNTIAEEKFVLEFNEESKEVRKSKKRSKKIISEAGYTLEILVQDKLNGRMGEC